MVEYQYFYAVMVDITALKKIYFLEIVMLISFDHNGIFYMCVCIVFMKK